MASFIPISAFLHLIRWKNLSILFATLYLLWYFLISKPSDGAFISFDILLLCLSTCLIAAGGYIINDYYDVKIDAINKPKRMVIDRKIHRMHAIYSHLFLSLTGLMVSACISLTIAGISYFSIFLLWLYSNLLKRYALIGNFTIAFLSFLAIYQLSLVFGHHYVIIQFGIFAFIISMIRELIKDLEDVEGDQKFGCKTFPILYGRKNTKWLVGFFYLILISSIGYLYMLHQSTLYLYLIISMSILFVFFIYKLYHACSTKDYRLLSNVAKIIMIVGLCGAFLV